MTCEITLLGGLRRLSLVLALLGLHLGSSSSAWAQWPIINEIHYHPPAVDRVEPVAEEFVELFNPSDTRLDLSGYAFTRGIRYTIPDGTILETQSYFVISADPGLVETDVQVLGP
jgi:hypothetical protein